MIAELLLGLASSLTASAVEGQLKGKLGYFERKKVEAKINEIVIAVMEPVATFLEREGIPLPHIKAISGSAKEITKWIISNPDFAFSRGLESDTITRDILSGQAKEFDLTIISEYPAAFETLLRSLIDLVVRVPPVFSEWERASFQAVFKQTEEIKGALSSIYSMMERITSNQNSYPNTFERVTNHRAASKALRMSIHGLRQSAVPQAEIDALFIFPSFCERKFNDASAEIIDEDETSEIETFNEFENFLSSSKSVIITAPAGAGKTTFSNWLSSKLLSTEGPQFPVVLPLRKLMKMDELPGLFSCISGEVSSVFREIVKEDEVSRWVKEGKVVFIFDGFDEVSEAERDRATEWIEALRIAHPSLVSIITSRPLSTDHLTNLARKSGWYDLELQPFDLQRVIAYIEAFQNHGPEIQTGAALQAPEKLAQTWKSDSTIGPLTGNPLLLSTLLVVHHMDGELPDDRSKLYDRYIDGMLGLWELNKELAAPTVPLTKEQKKKILELIAVNMISLETDAAAEGDVSNWLDEYLASQNISGAIKDILDHLRERSGLLVGPGQYTFAHKSIGEFLVAQACNDGIQVSSNGDRFDRHLLFQRCRKDRWTTVVFLWAGLASKAEVQHFITSLIKDGEFSLAAGLLFERRKFLDRVWLEAQFWNLLSVGMKKDGWLCQDESIFMKGPGCTVGTCSKADHVKLHVVTGISGEFFTEMDFVIHFLNEGICEPNRWHEHSLNFTEIVWVLFSCFVDLSSDFLKHGPKTLSVPAKCYWAVESRYNNAFGTSSSPLPFLSATSDREDIWMYETVLYLSEYCYIKEYSSTETFEKTIDEIYDDHVDERELDGDRFSRIQERFSYLRFKKISESGLFDLVESFSDRTFPETFTSILEDKVTTGRRHFGEKPIDEPTMTFAEKCQIALKKDIDNDEMKRLDGLARKILQRSLQPPLS